MDFYPYERLDNNQSQNKLWDWLKEAFKEDDGVAYYRFPIFSKQGKLNREPDILMLHRELGLWVFECKGCSIDNIQGIQGQQWQMNNWYDESITPVAQAEDQMYAIKTKLDEKRESRGKVNCNFRVALPNVKKKEWKEKDFDQLPTVGCVLLYDDLTPTALRKHIEDNAQKRQLSDPDWQLVKGVLGGTLPAREPRNIPTGTSPDNPLRVIQHIESQLKILDETQQKIAFEVPDGSQRLRGLAGTGKTVLLAKRAAKIHIKYPDWTIGFVFFTRSLYDQILELIALYHREMHPEHQEPNWRQLKVLHAWGGKNQQGFYYDLSQKCGLRPRNVNDVKHEKGKTSPGEAFEYVCNQLQNESDKIPVIYDALLIDEGQDLPPVFYQLAYESLSDPRRLYWAYDEAQGIGSLTVPEASEIFGRNTDGSLVVDLRGSYEGGISKGHRMKKCYRTPRLLLMTAHAINMGLFREDGALQGVTTKGDWNALGYDILSGSFQSVGKPVTITRPDTESPHPIDQPNFELTNALGSILTYHTFQTEPEEQKWIAEQIANDIALGFDPWDIFITALSGDYEKDYFIKMKRALESKGIKGYIAGVDGDPHIFRIDNCVTISGIYRAKGNESWKVYASRFQYATHPLSWKQEQELHKRNEAFVALTRSRVWCVATGLDNPIFDELQTAIKQYPEFTFLAFNKSSLKRQNDIDDSLAELPLFSGNI